MLRYTKLSDADRHTLHLGASTGRMLEGYKSPGCHQLREEKHLNQCTTSSFQAEKSQELVRAPPFNLNKILKWHLFRSFGLKTAYAVALGDNMTPVLHKETSVLAPDRLGELSPARTNLLKR